jgi:hypothetical protein
LSELLDIVEYLSESARVSRRDDFYTVHEMVWLQGSYSSDEPLTVEERKIVKALLKGKSFPRGYCFSNAQRIVLSDRLGRVKYTEGFAVPSGGGLFPLHHGWASIEGKVIDPTWIETPIDTPPAPMTYYGVSFTREYVARRLSTLKVRGSVIDDWRNGYPLLRRPTLPR